MIQKALPYLVVTLLFAWILHQGLPSYQYINSHDEDDNVVTGFLMSRNSLQMSKDIFSHHLPGAYLISETLDRTFQPVDTNHSVFIHRTFVSIWNWIWSLGILFSFGTSSLWLVFLVELLRAGYLHGLFHAENLVIYPMVFLLLTMLTGKKNQSLQAGLATGLISVLLAPLWPFILWFSGWFLWLNRHKPRRLITWTLAFFLPIVWAMSQIDGREFVKQFFGYNALTYAPLLIGDPLRYILKVFLAPGLVFRHISWTTTIITIQLLSFFLFVFDFNKIKLKNLIFFGLLLGVIGFRNVPGLNETLDFHVLPWVTVLGSLCWFKYFSLYKKSQRNWAWILVLLLPIILYSKNPSEYFPGPKSAGQMVIRYSQDSPVVNYLNSVKSTGDTLFTLPAHTLLYQQTQILPFNKFLFFLPWMEQSPILFGELKNSFQGKLPTFIFIDNVHFPYTPPKEIRELLVNYQKVTIASDEPPIYRLVNEGD